MSDNPYDSGRSFGIDHEDQFIPFKTEGSKNFNYFLPTDDEITTFPNMVLADNELEWDLHDV